MEKTLFKRDAMEVDPSSVQDGPLPSAASRRGGQDEGDADAHAPSRIDDDGTEESSVDPSDGAEESGSDSLTPLTTDAMSESSTGSNAGKLSGLRLGYRSALDWQSLRPGEVVMDSALQEESIVALYDRVFGRVRISISLVGGKGFSVAQALALANSLAASVPMARAMGRTRPDVPLACLPHLSVFLAEDATVPRASSREALRKLVLSGGALTARDRSLLLTLPDLRDRLQWTVAWVNNRCRASMAQGARRAAIPIVFRPLGAGGGQHVNLVSFSFSENETLVELFEPDGQEFYSKGGLGAYFSGLGRALWDQGLVRQRVRFNPVGRGVQTALGQWRFQAGGGGSYSLQERGYPVCGAVCVWAFSRFVASSYATLDAYDAELFARLTQSRQERHGLQLQFERFLRHMADWVESAEGQSKVAEAMKRNFDDSNVANLRVSRGGGGADESPPLDVRFSAHAASDAQVFVRQRPSR